MTRGHFRIHRTHKLRPQDVYVVAWLGHTWALPDHHALLHSLTTPADHLAARRVFRFRYLDASLTPSNVAEFVNGMRGTYAWFRFDMQVRLTPMGSDDIFTGLFAAATEGEMLRTDAAAQPANEESQQVEQEKQVDQQDAAPAPVEPEQPAPDIADIPPVPDVYAKLETDGSMRTYPTVLQGWDSAAWGRRVRAPAKVEKLVGEAAQIAQHAPDAVDAVYSQACKQELEVVQRKIKAAGARRLKLMRMCADHLNKNGQEAHNAWLKLNLYPINATIADLNKQKRNLAAKRNLLKRRPGVVSQRARRLVEDIKDRDLLAGIDTAGFAQASLNGPTLAELHDHLAH